MSRRRKAAYPPELTDPPNIVCAAWEPERDFSAVANSNSMNAAARRGDVDTLRLLIDEHRLCPNMVDNRGWTCLHEAASADHIQCVALLLNRRNVRRLAETHEGHTALYLACRNRCSLDTIRLLLSRVPHIAQYASTEMVSPLHVACQQGRLELVEVLLESDAIIDLRDFDGDTPLHDAAFSNNANVAEILLHAGAEPDLFNVSGYTPFHLACHKGNFETVKALRPFIPDIDKRAAGGETPLILATQSGSCEIVNYLLDYGADPDLVQDETTALYVSIIQGQADLVKILLPVTKIRKIHKNVIHMACKPHYFNMDVIVTLLESELGPEFFNRHEQFHVTLEEIGDIQPKYKRTSPLNSFLHISEYIYSRDKELFRKLFYLFLMRGVSINAKYRSECPPLVFLHYCLHTTCAHEIIHMLVEMGANIDYKSRIEIPDIIVASLATGGHTLPTLLQYSLDCEPQEILEFITQAGLMGRTCNKARESICRMLGHAHYDCVDCSTAVHIVPTLMHFARLRLRQNLRESGVKTTNDFLNALKALCLPKVMESFIRYM